MKKLLAAALVALSLVGSVFAQKTIVLDMAESSMGAAIEIKKNQYGTDYQSVNHGDFSQQLKGGMPEPGDIVQVHYKFTADKDLESLGWALIDTSAAANYWLPLFDADYPQVENIVKGQVYEGVVEFVITAAPKAKLCVVLNYNQAVSSKLTFQKTGVATTKIVKPKRAPKTWKVDLAKYSALINFAGNYPWVNGVQDRSTLLGYRAEVCINQAFGKDMPIVGDTIIINFKGVSTQDIAKIEVLLYEHAEYCGWWAELCPEDQQFQEWITDIKKNVPFKSTVKFNVVREPQEDVSLCFDYTLDDCNGSAIIKASK